MAADRARFFGQAGQDRASALSLFIACSWTRTYVQSDTLTECLCRMPRAARSNSAKLRASSSALLRDYIGHETESSGPGKNRPRHAGTLAALRKDDHRINLLSGVDVGAV